MYASFLQIRFKLNRYAAAVQRLSSQTSDFERQQSNLTSGSSSYAGGLNDVTDVLAMTAMEEDGGVVTSGDVSPGISLGSQSPNTAAAAVTPADIGRLEVGRVQVSCLSLSVIMSINPLAFTYH